MLDYNLKPWLLEVNHLPSFDSDTEVDETIKRDLINNVLMIENLRI